MNNSTQKVMRQMFLATVGTIMLGTTALKAQTELVHTTSNSDQLNGRGILASFGAGHLYEGNNFKKIKPDAANHTVVDGTNLDLSVALANSAVFGEPGVVQISKKLSHGRHLVSVSTAKDYTDKNGNTITAYVDEFNEIDSLGSTGQVLMSFNIDDPSSTGTTKIVYLKDSLGKEQAFKKQLVVDGETTFSVATFTSEEDQKKDQKDFIENIDKRVKAMQQNAKAGHYQKVDKNNDATFKGQSASYFNR